jgi:hypothetical protein
VDHAGTFEKMARFVFSTRPPSVDDAGWRVYGHLNEAGLN